MTKSNQHVVTHNGNWAVRGAGNEKVTSIHSTQSEAIQSARVIAINNRCEVVIHDRHGKIRDSDSYGKDFNPPTDKKH